MAGPTQNQIVGLASTVFAQGYLYATNPANSASFADNLIFGELETVSLDFKESSEHVVGPESLYALGAGATGRALTIKAQHAKIRAQALASLISNGAAPTLSGGRTLLSSNDAADFGNPKIQLHLLSPLAGDDIEFKVYAAYSTDLGLSLGLRKYTKPNWSCEACYSQADGKVWDAWLPGDQTAPDATTAPPAAPVASVAAGAVGTKQAIITYPSVVNAVSYSIEHSLAGAGGSAAGPFFVVGDTTNTTFIDVTPVAEQVWVRVRALGSAGYGQYSAVVNVTTV